MKYLFLLLTLFSTTLCFGQPYHRLNGETSEAFVKRITRTANLAHPVIETDEWDPTHQSILYFLPYGKEEKDIIGYVLVPKSMMTYRKVLIDTFFQEGGDPRIDQVFFANADKDKEQELIIVVQWPQGHSRAGLVGTLYGTHIYDDPSPVTEEYQLKFFKELSERLDGGFEGKRNGEMVKAEFKTAAQIKAALRKLGY